MKKKNSLPSNKVYFYQKPEKILMYTPGNIGTIHVLWDTQDIQMAERCGANLVFTFTAQITNADGSSIEI